MQRKKGAIPVMGFGHWLFAIGMIGLGFLGLISSDFALVWQPVPEWVPGRSFLADACGVLMLAGGIALFWPRFIRLASCLLFIYLLLWLLLLRLPQLAIAPLTVGSWSGCGENAVLLAGGWALFTFFAPPQSGWPLKGLPVETRLRIARFIFGVALLPCGLAHFAYAQATAAFVPGLLPWHLGWAYMTGAAFIAAGMGILVGICARLAAILASGMMSAFTLLVWVPGVLAAPNSRFQWTALFISWTIAAAGWIVADTYRGTAWLMIYQRRPKGESEAPA